MKKGTFLTTIIGMAIFYIGLIACDKNDEEEVDSLSSLLVGTWMMDEGDSQTFVRFNSNGTGVRCFEYQGKEEERSSFTYTYNSNKRELILNMEDEIYVCTIVNINPGKALTLKDSDGTYTFSSINGYDISCVNVVGKWKALESGGHTLTDTEIIINFNADRTYTWNVSYSNPSAVPSRTVGQYDYSSSDRTIKVQGKMTLGSLGTYDVSSSYSIVELTDTRLHIRSNDGMSTDMILMRLEDGGDIEDWAYDKLPVGTKISWDGYYLIANNATHYSEGANNIIINSSNSIKSSWSITTGTYTYRKTGVNMAELNFKVSQSIPGNTRLFTYNVKLKFTGKDKFEMTGAKYVDSSLTGNTGTLELHCNGMIE